MPLFLSVIGIAFFPLSEAQCLLSCQWKAMPPFPLVVGNGFLPVSLGLCLPSCQLGAMPPPLNQGQCLLPSVEGNGSLSVEGNASLPLSDGNVSLSLI